MNDILSSPIAEMHSGLFEHSRQPIQKMDHDNNIGDNNAALSHFTEALAELASYLAPNSDDTAEEISVDDVDSKASNGNLCDNSISEITAYVSSVIYAYETAAGKCVTTSSDISAPSSSSVNDTFLCSIRHINETLFDVNETSIVREHATLNLTHCRKLLSWLRKERMPWLQDTMVRADLPENIASEFRTFVQEYFDWASGPWKDVVLLDFLLTTVVPPLLRICIEENKLPNNAVGPLHLSGDKGDVDIRSPSTETEKEMSVSDEASDLLSILSLNGTRRKGHGGSHKASAMVIQKLKTDVAVLKAALEKSNMSDIDMMEDKLRRTTNETTKLKSVNNELRSRISLLEEELYHLRNNVTTGTLQKSNEKTSNLTTTSTITTSTTIAKEITPSSSTTIKTNLVEISPRKNISVREGIRIYDPKNPSSLSSSVGGGKRSPKTSGSSSGSGSGSGSGGSSGPDDDEFSDAMALDDLPSSITTMVGHPRQYVVPSTVSKVFATVRMSRTMDTNTSSNTIKDRMNSAVGYESDIGKRRSKSVHPLLAQKERDLAELEATNKRLRRTLSLCEERMSALQDKLDEAQSRTVVTIDSGEHQGIPSVVDFIPSSSGTTDVVTLSVPPPAPPSVPPPNNMTSTVAVGKKQTKDKRVNFADNDLPSLDGWIQQAVGEIMSVLPTTTDLPITSPVRASTVAGIPMPRPKRSTSKSEMSATVTAAIAQAIHLAKKDDEKMITALASQVKRLTNILSTEQRTAIENSDGDESQDDKPSAVKDTIYFHEFESVTVLHKNGKDPIMRWTLLQKVNKERYAKWLEATVSPKNEREKKIVSVEKVLSTALSNDNPPPFSTSSSSSSAQGFSVIHLLMSFFFGLFFMLLVVSVSHWVALKYFAHMLLK